VRAACIAMACYFAFATAVQANDPDALLWGSFYGATAAVSLLAAWRTPPFWMPAAVATIAALWALALAPSALRASFRELFQSWRMMSAGMEVGREFLGLVIVATWMAVLARRVRDFPPSRSGGRGSTPDTLA
jgi:hypothetical protein